MHGRTTLVIAHRLSTIKNSDCIMVLEQGHIIERGNHQSLIKEKVNIINYIQELLKWINPSIAFLWTKRPLKEEKLKDKISIRNEAFVRQTWDKY